jgi:hypothetical protein
MRRKTIETTTLVKTHCAFELEQAPKRKADDLRDEQSFWRMRATAPSGCSINFARSTKAGQLGHVAVSEILSDTD